MNQNTNTNAAANTTSAQGNVWLNNVHKAMVHDNTSAAGKAFKNISFDCPSSATGLASVSVNPGQVYQATDKSGAPKADWVNVLLGKPGTTRKVSIKKADGTYERVEMSVEQIKASFEAGRKAYRDAHKGQGQPAVATESENAAPAQAAAAAATEEAKPARKRSSKKSK